MDESHTKRFLTFDHDTYAWAQRQIWLAYATHIYHYRRWPRAR